MGRQRCPRSGRVKLVLALVRLLFLPLLGFLLCAPIDIKGLYIYQLALVAVKIASHFLPTLQIITLHQDINQLFSLSILPLKEMAAAATVLPTRPAGAAGATRDEYSEYALAVQTAANNAVRSIKGKSELQGLAWATPLSAAPSAVGTMAILFKTASAKAAAGLPVTSRDIKDGTGQVLDQLR
jgi:hypothetical protein